MNIPQKLEGVVWSAELSGLTPEGEEEIRYGALLGEIVGLEQEGAQVQAAVDAVEKMDSAG